MSHITINFDKHNRLKVIEKNKNLLDVCFKYEERGNFLKIISLNNKEINLYVEYEEAIVKEGSKEIFLTLETIYKSSITSILKDLLDIIEKDLIKIAYSKFSNFDYIYKFRNKKQRNTDIYSNQKKEIYQSKLCSAIKNLRRKKENISNNSVCLNFGIINYVLPSHFGFCLGVQNAIERAYETISKYPKKRIYMLSELIHNPFVNNDLNKRGLKYLQTAHGEWLNDKNEKVLKKDDPSALWNKIKFGDIVIIPAFGATNNDKLNLIKKGIILKEFDATCMLVEKVWKSIKEHSSFGFTTIIHGKFYHEETKATFSNAITNGPALVIEDMGEAKILGEILSGKCKKPQELFDKYFSNRCSPNFSIDKDLKKIAIVNQTTLLRNLTMKIIDYLKNILIDKYGKEKYRNHLWENKKGDTLCYATQVNQDALLKAINNNIDYSLVVGGSNSSNTFQLFQICKDEYGSNAYFIQSEENIENKDWINHCIYSKTGNPTYKRLNFLDIVPEKPINILITGGASCPDGIIQQIITKINSFFPSSNLRSLDDVLNDLNNLSILDN